MTCFADMPLFGDTRLLVGMDGDRVVFSHIWNLPGEREALIRQERQHFKDLTERPAEFAPLFDLLGAYRDGRPVDPAGVPVMFSRGTDFQKKVWQTLRKIPRGARTTYRRLAADAGFPRAQQAVGQAMARNYLVLFVPCHRVVASDDALGGFSGGVDNKRMLLEIEKKIL